MSSVHVVAKGDTLWAIAKKYLGSGSRYMEIAKLNGIENPNLIYPGQKFKIPGKEEPLKAPAPATPSKPNEPPKGSSGVGISPSNENENNYLGWNEQALDAKARVMGNPLLRAKRTVRVNNVGKKFSGVWYISEVRHVIDSTGYTCELTLTRGQHNANGELKSTGTANSGISSNSTGSTTNKNPSSSASQSNTPSTGTKPSTSGSTSASKPSTGGGIKIDAVTGEVIKK